MEANKEKGISFQAVPFFTCKVEIIEDIPSIAKMLNIFEPITFPKAISEEPDSTAEIETTSSGAEVPKATIVNPITIGETFNLLAIELAPSINKSLDLINKNIPTENRIKYKKITKFSIRSFKASTLPVY